MTAVANAAAVFVDTNVLVYATIAESPWHAVASRALRDRRSAGETLWISRQVIREYINTILRLQAPPRLLPAPDVVAAVRLFKAHFRVADDTDAVTERLLRLVERVPMGSGLVHDANVVATMQAYAITHLLTHNSADFARFAHLVTIVPLI